MLSPSGSRVPSFLMILISISFLWASLEQMKIQDTVMSSMLWSLEVKCCATGETMLDVLMSLKCSLNLSLNILLVSPMYSLPHFVQVIQYTMFLVVHVADDVIVQVDFGPVMAGLLHVCAHVRQRPFPHGKVPGISDVSTHDDRTRRSLMLRPRLLHRMGRSSKRAVVVGSSLRIFQFFFSTLNILEDWGW